MGSEGAGSLDEPAASVGPEEKVTLRRRVRVARRTRARSADRAADARALADAFEEAFSVELDSLRRDSAGSSPAHVQSAGEAGDAGPSGSAGPTPNQTGDPDYAMGPCVAAYVALPTEPPCEELVARLRARGIRVIVPALLPDLDLDWRELRAGGDLGPLLGRRAIGSARVLVVPALSVDSRGTRLGQGGGSYDRALTRRAPDALVVAAVYQDEYVDGPLPSEQHDHRVNAVVTPNGVRRTGVPG